MSAGPDVGIQSRVGLASRPRPREAEPHGLAVQTGDDVKDLPHRGFERPEVLDRPGPTIEQLHDGDNGAQIGIGGRDTSDVNSGCIHHRSPSRERHVCLALERDRGPAQPAAGEDGAITGLVPMRHPPFLAGEVAYQRKGVCFIGQWCSYRGDVVGDDRFDGSTWGRRRHIAVLSVIPKRR